MTESYPHIARESLVDAISPFIPLEMDYQGYRRPSWRYLTLVNHNVLQSPFT